MSTIDPCAPGVSVSKILAAMPPRTVEGDQGRWTSHTVHDAIAADQYERKVNATKSRVNMASVLRAMNHRLLSHDGRAT